MPLVIYGPEGVHTRIHTYTFVDESDYKKPDARRPADAVHLV